MSSIKQNIRSVLADVESFLVETLKSVKLNSGARDQKDRLLERIWQLLEEFPGSASSQLDSSASGGSLKISGGGDSGSGGTSSSNLQTLGDDDSGYADNIPKKAASELKNKLQTGTLEKKKKTGFRTWDALYCVVSGNVFYMYKKQGDSKQKEAFCLSGYECHEAPGLEKDTSKKEMCFEVTKAGAPTYQFRAGSKEGMVIWKEAITKGIQIATDEEPGAESNLYDDADLYLEPGHRSYEALHQIKSNSDDDDGIYDDLDNLPSFHAPPVPRASTLPPLPAKGRELGGGYANLSPNVHAAAAEEKPKPSSANRASSGTMVHADTTAAVSNVFAKSKSAEKPVLPSEIKKEIARGGGVGNKPQGPPPMIDIFKQSARENTANNTPGKAESDSAVISQTSASGANFTKAATGQANNKSPSANANKNPGLELKSPPAANTNNNPGLKLKSPPAANGNKNPGLKSPSSHPNKNRDLPAPPTAGDGKLAKDSSAESSRDAPPARGPGVGSLKQMFEK